MRHTFLEVLLAIIIGLTYGMNYNCCVRILKRDELSFYLKKGFLVQKLIKLRTLDLVEYFMRTDTKCVFRLQDA